MFIFLCTFNYIFSAGGLPVLHTGSSDYPLIKADPDNLTSPIEATVLFPVPLYCNKELVDDDLPIQSPILDSTQQHFIKDEKKKKSIQSSLCKK